MNSLLQHKMNRRWEGLSESSDYPFLREDDTEVKFSPSFRHEDMSRTQFEAEVWSIIRASDDIDEFRWSMELVGEGVEEGWVTFSNLLCDNTDKRMDMKIMHPEFEAMEAVKTISWKLNAEQNTHAVAKKRKVVKTAKKGKAKKAKKTNILTEQANCNTNIPLLSELTLSMVPSLQRSILQDYCKLSKCCKANGTNAAMIAALQAYVVQQ
jgi:hypothetical protein